MNKSALLFASLMTITYPAVAEPFLFNTGNVNGLMAAATRPSSAGKFEIEAGDDFIVSSHTQLKSATFTSVSGPRLAAHWNRHCRWKSCSDLQYGVLAPRR